MCLTRRAHARPGLLRHDEEQSQQRLAKLRADQLARTEHEARLAQRQYQAVDPDNRLVAAELERRWEISLQRTRNQVVVVLVAGNGIGYLYLAWWNW